MAAPSGREARVLCNVVGDDGGGNLVHLEAAVGLWNFDAAQSKFARLLEKLARDGEIFVLDLLHIGQDFVDCKFFRSLADELMLLGEIFRVKTSAGVRSSRRKLPPEIFVLGTAVVVAMLIPSDTSWRSLSLYEMCA